MVRAETHSSHMPLMNMAVTSKDTTCGLSHPCCCTAFLSASLWHCSWQMSRLRAWKLPWQLRSAYRPWSSAWLHSSKAAQLIRLLLGTPRPWQPQVTPTLSPHVLPGHINTATAGSHVVLSAPLAFEIAPLSAVLGPFVCDVGPLWCSCYKAPR